jgi:polyhydroxyalkanoate synthesis regulator protein
MTEAETPLVLRRSTSKRLYDPTASADLTLDDPARRIGTDGDFIVTNFETGDQITGRVRKQIIIELGRHG